MEPIPLRRSASLFFFISRARSRSKPQRRQSPRHADASQWPVAGLIFKGECVRPPFFRRTHGVKGRDPPTCQRFDVPQNGR